MIIEKSEFETQIRAGNLIEKFFVQTGTVLNMLKEWTQGTDADVDERRGRGPV